MIKIEDLFKKYDDQIVLDEFSHEFVNKGITCLLGASGSGKSTLLNLLAGFDREYSGKIVVDGQNIADLSSEAISDYRKDTIGFVFQEYHLLAGYTVLENILLAAELVCDDNKKNKEWALEILGHLGIEEKANEKTENLSGGQKQRVAIARALVGNPKLILADEPTGALDRENASEIMEILSEIGKKVPVLIITHDNKICDYADEIITIENGKCKLCKEAVNPSAENHLQKNERQTISVSMTKRALHNFRVYFRRFLGISLAVTIAVCAVLMSFSSQNMIEEKIRDFEEKNTAFAWGQVTVEDENMSGKVMESLKQSSQVERSYAQYLIPESSISLEEKNVSLPPKNFGSIAAEFMNFGVMPRENEIAVTPSLGKKLADDLRSIIGDEITFTCGDFSKKLKITGVYNGSFDDFYLDAQTEQELYKALKIDEPPISVAYQVKSFYDVAEVEAQLISDDFQPVTASEQVESLKETFTHLQTFFLIVSGFIVVIAVIICIMLLMKTAKMRTGEMGLLMALGYRCRQIRQMLFFESMFLSAMSALTTVLFSLILMTLSGVLPVCITPFQVVLSICGTVLLVWLTTAVSNVKLLKTDPVKALKE